MSLRHSGLELPLGCRVRWLRRSLRRAALRSTQQKFSYPQSLNRFMENQTKREQQRAVLVELLGVVNSKEEFESIEAELARLDAEESAGDGGAQPWGLVAAAMGAVPGGIA